ncbi:MAG: RsmB/NOP family class I SAM-dependent RNA methyltransferase [Lachnospiraceae bacterium]|nr:RsmB/NOP family class I SAM-dependent RNA methyltransferase [Lachnospiraceae bacterium]
MNLPVEVLPKEFQMRMEALLGDEYPSFLKTYEEPRRYGLRVNTLKISAEEFCRIAPFHLSPIPWISSGFFYEKEDTPSRHPYYYAGLYYLQEPSAMTPAQILPVNPGDRVLDLCAAPGGKATALAEKLRGRGLLVANDISTSRAKALLKNLEIFGVANAIVTNTTPFRLSRQFPEFFDKILVDAPCSGEGMFRKDIASAKDWSLTKVHSCAKKQKEILLQAASMLRPGGMMLYSTCTFSPEENEQVIMHLLENCPEMELLPISMAESGIEGFSHGRPELAMEGWEQRKSRQMIDDRGKNSPSQTMEDERQSQPEQTMEDAWQNMPPQTVNDQKQYTRLTAALSDINRCIRIFPHKMPGEGHFMALLKKRSKDFPVSDKRKSSERPELSGILFQTGADRHAGKQRNSLQTKATGQKKDSDQKFKTDEKIKLIDSFIKDTLKYEDTFSGRRDIKKGIDIHGSQAYYMPETPDVIKGIPFLRSGLYLGEIKKDRFEPSQAFAMAVRVENCLAVLDFDHVDKRVEQYLRGETIEIEDLSPQNNCWQLVCVNGYPLGWGKLVGTALKNKYHPGWRMQNP